MFQHLIEYLYDPRIMADATHMESILRGVGTIDPIHRRGCPRSHRQWKRRRAAGLTKRVRR